MMTPIGALRSWRRPSPRLVIYIILTSALHHSNSAVANDDSSEKGSQRLIEIVVVTGTRTPYSLNDSPVEVQLIDAAQIARSGARDVAELLEREGGVYANRAAGRGSAIQIQGLSSKHVLILLNGRRMIGRINGAIDLSRLHVADIERIEIVKGPSSALYGGDALGGVVNIISQREGEGGALILRGDDAGN
jgi:outer membrane receptor for ferrienterochelin and colicins